MAKVQRTCGQCGKKIEATPGLIEAMYTRHLKTHVDVSNLQNKPTQTSNTNTPKESGSGLKTIKKLGEISSKSDFSPLPLQINQANQKNDQIPIPQPQIPPIMPVIWDAKSLAGFIEVAYGTAGMAYLKFRHYPSFTYGLFKLDTDTAMQCGQEIAEELNKAGVQKPKWLGALMPISRLGFEFTKNIQYIDEEYLKRVKDNYCNKCTSPKKNTKECKLLQFKPLIKAPDCFNKTEEVKK